MRFLLTLLTLGFVLNGFCAGATSADRTLHVVVVTGGHDFDTTAFPGVFAGYPDVQVTFAEQRDQSELFEDVSEWKYDVIVFYNMGQKISEKRQANLLSLLEKGVGVVAMHHCIAAYASWPEWARIIGGKYFEKEAVFEGAMHRPSTYQHDVPFACALADRKHPVTAGLEDFRIVDETYKFQWVDPQVHLLLTTRESTSDTTLAWTKKYRNARVCYIQLGHGPSAYNNASYRRLVVQAIRWAAQ
jgi:uncharacterized protein